MDATHTQLRVTGKIVFRTQLQQEKEEEEKDGEKVGHMVDTCSWKNIQGGENR